MVERDGTEIFRLSEIGAYGYVFDRAFIEDDSVAIADIFFSVKIIGDINDEFTRVTSLILSSAYVRNEFPFTFRPVMYQRCLKNFRKYGSRVLFWLGLS